MSSWSLLFISIIAGVIAIVVWAGVRIIYGRLRPRVCIRTGNVKIQPKILLKPTLNWFTFIDGIDHLKEQLAYSSPKFIPDLFVGINRGGTAVAAMLKPQEKPMAIFRVEAQKIEHALPCVFDQSKKNMVLNFLFSDSPGKVNILLIDEEFKTGSAAKAVIDYLTSEWGFNEKNIRIAVLALAEVKIKYSRLFKETIIIDESNGILFPKINFSAWRKEDESKSGLKDKLLFISYLSPASVSFPWEK